MLDQLTIIFVNNSGASGNVCLYQKIPEGSSFPIAWFTEHVHPTSRASFTWDPSDIGFVWSQTGQLSPGISCGVSQFWKSDLSTDNQVNFTRQDDAYTFENQCQGQQPGFLTIRADSTLIPEQASVGTGMAGAATQLMQASLNMNYEFVVHPEYWISFGEHTRGEVIDIETVTSPAQIKFPVNTHSMTAILQHDSTWTIAPTWQVNNSYTQARKENNKIRFGCHKI